MKRISTVFLAGAALGLLTFSLITAPPSDPLSCEDCNVIVIGFDALQAAHVHSLGNARETTPTLDALAARGFSFTNALAPASWTVPSFMSILTGTYPSVHKVTNKFTVFTQSEKHITNLKELSPNILTLAEYLKAHGYATAGFTGDAGVSGKFGYAQGFDTYLDDVAFGSMSHSDQFAVPWLDKNKGKKFFMFFHGYDAHGQFALTDPYHSRYEPRGYAGPYTGTAKEQAALREQGLAAGRIDLSPADVEFWRAWYDGKIRDADERLGVFLAELDQRHLLDKTIIIVVADHGTEFYEHGRFDHGHTLYDELVHVPFIIVPPHATSGTRIASQVTTLDMVPTVLSLLGLENTDTFHRQQRGTSLVPTMRGLDARGENVFMETDYRNYVHLRAVQTADHWKYILSLTTKKEELYDLTNDPGEKKNLAATETAKKETLRHILLAHMRDDLNETVDDTFATACLPVYDGQCK